MTKLAAYTGPELAAEADPFAKVRELGFDYIEIAGRGLPFPEDDTELPDWAERLERLSLEPRSHCDPAANEHFYSTDRAERLRCLDETKCYITNSAGLGIRSVVIHPSEAEASPDETERDKATPDENRVIEALAALQEHASSVNIQLELECGSKPFNGNPRKLAWLCREVPGIGIAIDMGHAFRSAFCLDGSDTLGDWIGIAGPCVKSIQFNDVTLEGDRFVQTAVGRGEVPYDELMPRLLDLGCEWWTIELASTADLVESKEYLDRFLP